MAHHPNWTVSILSSKRIHKFFSLFIIILFLCVVIPVPVNAATSVSQYGITWTFNANCQTGQFVNGDYWVVGPVTITSISPATAIVGSRTENGSMLNPAMGTSQGYDSSITYFTYNSSLNVARNMPLTIPAGNSLVSTISLASPFPGGAKYSLKTAAVLTVMASAPPSGTFRPSYYYGADKTAKYNWSAVQANKSLLQNLNPQMDLTKSSAGQYYTWPGNLTSFLPTIQRVWLDHRSDWTNEYLAPQDNMGDYGSNLADKLGWASLLLQSQLPAGWVKDDLLIAFVQKGIDWSGAIQHQAAGNNGWTPDGGHSIGRKWPVMFAAIMLNDTALLNYIKTKSGDYAPARYSIANGFSATATWPSDAVSFAEDGQTFIVSSIDISLNRGGNYTGSPSTSYLSSDLGLPEYGMYHSVCPQDDDRWWKSNHRQVNSGTLYGAFALAALIMGQRANWNHDAFFDYTDRFSEVSLTLQLNNSYPWKAHETAIALNMWKAYRKTYIPYWTRSNPTAVAVPNMTNPSDKSYLNGSLVDTRAATYTVPGVPSDNEPNSTTNLQFGNIPGKKNAKVTINDTNDVPVTFSLTGGGYGEVIGGANFDQVNLYNTSEKSQLIIKSKTGTSIGDINSNGPLKAITSKTINLRGDITVTGSLGILTLSNITNSNTITIGPSDNPKAGVVMNFDRISGLTINSQMPITSLSATEWLGGSINTPYIGSITTKGDKKRVIPGDLYINATRINGVINTVKVAGTLSGVWDCNIVKSITAADINHADLTLSKGPDAKVPALGKLTVAGWIDSCAIASAGNIGSIITGGIRNSSCFAGSMAGVDDNNDGVLDLPNPPDVNGLGDATIGTFAVKGIKGESYCMTNSNIAALRFNTVLLSWPQYANNNVDFGVAADSIKKATVKDANGITTSYSKLVAGKTKTIEDFVIRLK